MGGEGGYPLCFLLFSPLNISTSRIIIKITIKLVYRGVMKLGFWNLIDEKNFKRFTQNASFDE